MAKSRELNPNSSVQHFEARLEQLRSRLRWVVVYIRFDAAKVWGLRGQIKVKGEINGFPFRTSLFSRVGAGQFILVNKAMQKGASVREGSLARIRIEPDHEERIVVVPGQLKRIFRQERSLSTWFGKLNYSTRADIVKWIAEPKSDEARARRANQIAERLVAVMDAERELPPMFRAAFSERPRARDGWELMSPAGQRRQLFAVFYYRTPGGQARRLAKVLDATEEFYAEEA